LSTNKEKIMNLSKTSLVLLLYSKSDIEGNKSPTEWEDIRAILASHYGSTLRFIDILNIVLTSYFELLTEPRFELNSDKYIDLLLAPIKGYSSIELYGPNTLETSYSVEQFYISMMRHILSNLRIARTDWCEEYKDYAIRKNNLLLT